jgi:flagellar hook assembly protein FlgD
VAAGIGTQAAGAAPSTARRAPAVELGGPSTFSPNRDGRLDRARFTIAVKKRSKVKVKVVRNGERVKGPVHLGEHRAGTRLTWAWGGRDNHGKRVQDAPNYHVKVLAKATRSGETHVAETSLRLDTVFQPKVLVVHADTVYPRTKVAHDRLWFGLRYPDDFRADSMGRGTLRITKPGGKLVYSRFTRGWDRNYPFTDPFPVAWDGRDGDGKRVPAGKYWARVRARDAGSNSGQTRRIPIRVSDERLVVKTGTATVTAADSYQVYNPCERSTANGCGDFPPCGSVVASTGYPDPEALTYRSGTGCSPDSYRHLAIGTHVLTPLAHTPRGLAVSRVTLRGKPTTAGEADAVRLSVRDVTVTGAASTQESLTTATPGPVAPQTLVRAPKAAWNVFTTGEDSYDVADFAVDYVYLAPR